MGSREEIDADTEDQVRVTTLTPEDITGTQELMAAAERIIPVKVPAADNHVIWVDEINDFIPTIPDNIILGEE